MQARLAEPSAVGSDWLDVDVVLVARGDHLAALRERGLRLRTPDEDVTQSVPAIGGPEEIELDVDDVLILATKTQQANEALVTWADAPVHQNARPVGTAGVRLPIFIALNGVAAEAIAHRYFRRVYGVCVWMPVVHLVPGEVIIRSTPRSGMLHIGRVPASADDHDQALQQVATDLVAANFDVPLPDDVMPWKYRKLISNIGNVFQALVARNGDWHPLVTDAEAEARRVLDAAGIGYISEAEESAARAAGFTMKPVPGVPAVRRWIDLAVAAARHGEHRNGLSQRRNRDDRAPPGHRGADQPAAGHTGSAARPPVAPSPAT